MLNIKRTIEKGYIDISSYYFEKVMNHCFYNELRVDPYEIVLTFLETPLNTEYRRKKLVNLFFEYWNVEGFYLGCDSVMNLISKAKTNGISIDMGYDKINIAPIYDSVPVYHSIEKMGIGGIDITNYICKLLSKSQYDDWNTTTFYKDIARKIKIDNCYLLSKNIKKPPFDYELPDGSKININKEAFQSCELLFKPSLIGLKKESNLTDSILKSLDKCDKEMKEYINKNLVFGGGSSAIKGLKERMNEEFSKKKINLTVLEDPHSPECKYSNWIGASIFSKLSSFEKIFIQKDEYNEVGDVIVQRKCFSQSSLYKFDYNISKKITTILLCNSKKESPFYKIPIEVVKIILSFFSYDLTPYFIKSNWYSSVNNYGKRYKENERQFWLPTSFKDFDKSSKYVKINWEELTEEYNSKIKYRTN